MSVANAKIAPAFFKLLGLQLMGGSAKQPDAIKSYKFVPLTNFLCVYFRYCMIINVWSITSKHLTTILPSQRNDQRCTTVCIVDFN